MTFDTASVMAFAALVWTGYQEIRLWKMCAACPYKQAAEAFIEEEK